METITINNTTYRIEKNGDEIRLQRFNEEYKMWVTLFFPIGKQFDDSSFIEILSNLYINRHLTACNS